MAHFVNYKGLNYDDIGIVASLGVVESRTEIPIEGFRLVVAGMSSVIGDEFLKEWAQLPAQIRPTIHIQRDKNSIKHLEMIANWNLQDWIWVGLGMKTPDIEDAALKLGFKNILLDIAFGGLPQVKIVYNRLRNKFGDNSKIIVGSIMTQEQAHYLNQIGYNGFRLGVATGDVCRTKYQTGVFCGAVTEIMQVYDYLQDEIDVEGEKKFIVADGGFKYAGDFSKAFALGAQYCMSGSIFTKCKSAQMHIDGTHTYYGMSSKNKGVRAGETCYDEAFEKKKEGTRELLDLLTEIWGGIRSTVSYMGYSTLTEAIGNGEFVELKTPLQKTDW